MTSRTLSQPADLAIKRSARNQRGRSYLSNGGGLHRVQPSTDPDWLTVRQVALKLSVSSRQVRKWLACGQFDEIAVFSKRLTRISLAAYQRFVEKNKAA